MADLATAIFDRVLADDKTAPEWVHLLLSGMMTARDGRRFDLADPEAVVATFHADGIDLPIDYQHQNDHQPDLKSGPVPAAGWIKELKVDPSGLWGRVEWTVRARELIANKEYRYLSPSIMFNPIDLKIIKLKGAGLVHNPALRLTALASQEDTMPDLTTFMQRLAVALNLPPDSDAETLFAAIANITKAAGAPDPAKFVPIKALQDVLKDRNTSAATMSETSARAKVEEAMRRGYITPSMKDWATALCTQDEASFESFLGASIPHFAHLNRAVLPNVPPPSRSPAASPVAEAVSAQLGLKPGALME